MNQSELDQEILECSRYGEEDDLKAIIAAGGNVNHSDEAGNTGLHRAAANGHVGCINILLDHGAVYRPNSSGNYPIHWAAQNGQLEALKSLFNRVSECDVLTQNSFGRSTLTEAFDSKNPDILEACLTHPSSSEDRMFPTKNNQDEKIDTIDEVDDDGDANNDNQVDVDDSNAIFHDFNFAPIDANINKTLRVRELPISRADNPFGSDINPEDDTTGLGIWPASILAAQWISKSTDIRAAIKGKILLELGAGVGVPSLAAGIQRLFKLFHEQSYAVVATYSGAKQVFISDINDKALNNASFNVKCNSIPDSYRDFIDTNIICEGIIESCQNNDNNEATKSVVRVIRLNWMDEATFPKENIDVVLGSDLIYERRILVPLTVAVSSLLSLGGLFLYVAPDENRDGMDDLLQVFNGVGLKLRSQAPCLEEYYQNPIIGEDNDDQYVLHFYDLPARKKFSMYVFEKTIIPELEYK